MQISLSLVQVAYLNLPINNVLEKHLLRVLQRNFHKK